MALSDTLSLDAEEKIYVGKSYLFIKDRILHVVTVGDSDRETALQMKEVSIAITLKYGKMHVLADINEAGKSTPEARKIWKELSEASNFKLALVGLHPVARVIASFSMALSRNKTTRFFVSTEEALEWLKS
ncbi:MAG TPA: STAS/SEC14 domain-containing protein [Cytophagales bacterium]|nr:STAS/SEC14 domain-containing protein [Cytophagales bacterium]